MNISGLFGHILQSFSSEKQRRKPSLKKFFNFDQIWIKIAVNESLEAERRLQYRDSSILNVTLLVSSQSDTVASKLKHKKIHFKNNTLNEMYLEHFVLVSCEKLT